MKYKIGDKVKIKTWDQMKEEFGVGDRGSINCEKAFTDFMELLVRENFSNRVLIIKEVRQDSYHMRDDEDWFWTDDMIECLVGGNIFSGNIEPSPSKPLKRWQILDIRE